MATTLQPQRSYRAACPNCGAPVEFRSPASAFAVCSFCRSTVVHEGDALRQIGHSAELFDDHSPLQLGAAGTAQGSAFTLVGRLQYRYEGGTWNEWHALFDTGRSGWLSEDNGRYVLCFDAPLPAAAPAAASLQPGAQHVIAGQSWSVASVTTTTLMAAQGELPRLPKSGGEFMVADLRSARGEVATLDYADAASPVWSIGQSVALSELAMTGLADSSEKTLQARGIECPSCGAALEIKLSTTQSISCHQCDAVVDVSQGVGADLQHYAQDNGGAPQIPLGSVGHLALGTEQPLPWQVVGYVERVEVDAEAGEEQSFWREYLLYHRTEGFAFLVDAEDGWSWAMPITGAPQPFGESVKHDGVLYRKLYRYGGEVTYVVGEFYWQLTRRQRTDNTDYAGTGSASAKRLNREQTSGANTQEIVWSGGETLSADAVLKAFSITAPRAALLRDAGPTTFNGASLLAKLFFWVFAIVMVLTMFNCSGPSRAECNTVISTYGEASQEAQNCLNSRSRARTGGGSYGGFSSGGSHK